MQIECLADYPELRPELAAWFYAEWGHHRLNNSVEQVEARLLDYSNRDEIPLTLIAISDGELLGSAILRFDDLEARKDLSPWLAGVYVADKHRGKGVGSQLVEAIEERARHLNVQRLFLYTYDRESFYRRLGWSVLEYTEYANKVVVVMYKPLNSASKGNTEKFP